MKKIVMAGVLGLFAVGASAENIPYEQAQNAGVKKCLPAIKKISLSKMAMPAPIASGTPITPMDRRSLPSSSATFPMAPF